MESTEKQPDAPKPAETEPLVTAFDQEIGGIKFTAGTKVGEISPARVVSSTDPRVSKSRIEVRLVDGRIVRAGAHAAKMTATEATKQPAAVPPKSAGKSKAKA